MPASSASPARPAIDHRGYVAAGHAVQREVRAAIESLTGVGLSEDQCGIDGCSIPT